MKLERHVGSLGRARQANYLESRGWQLLEAGWVCERHTLLPLKLSRALHHQLTEDLCAGLAPSGWKVAGFSDRGYARLIDPTNAEDCSLPAALRKQARREGRKAAEFTYSLFLAAMLRVP